MMGERRLNQEGAVLRLQPRAARPGQSPASQHRPVCRPFGGPDASGAVPSETGRPSIDPELMMRMLIVGYRFGIRSERRLCDEVHLNYRWFCRLGLDGDVPDHLRRFLKEPPGALSRERSAAETV